MLDALVGSIQASRKYRCVCPDLIRAIGQRELAARRNLKEAEKATRNKLHQVAGAYLDHRPRYGEWLETLTAAHGSGEEARFREACAAVLRGHASTAERLSFLPEFYATVFDALPPVRSILDVACGLHPLGLPWMPLPPDAAYRAYDLFSDMADFLNAFFALVGVDGLARACDVLTSPPQEAVDLALVLKALPPFEQIDRAAPLTLLKSLRARHILVSFPTRTLGGRSKGMAENYEARFRALIAQEPWQVRRLAFPTELCFLLTKEDSAL